jgi:hypothetical protein
MSSAHAPSPTPQMNPYGFWAARIWQGMTAKTWARLALRHHAAFSPSRWGLALTTTAASLFNSTMQGVERLRYGQQVARYQLEQPPVFILGHWRSGTTLLHELLVLDERHFYPTTFQCFCPNHFLVTEWFFKYMTFLLPAQRPMDNMLTGWERPQEDEFALCNMGSPSPYVTMAFPNHPPEYTEYLDFDGVSDEAIARWQRDFMWFLKRVALKKQGRIVLKSPPHTGRIKVLLQMFPDARFVHIVRNPYSLFPSTMKLWKSLYMVQGLQAPQYAGLEEYVFQCFERMYAAFDAQRSLIPAENFYEVRYEDLVADPIGQVRSMYEQLNLGDVTPSLPKLQAYVEGMKEYKKNQFALEPDLRAQIDRRWGPFFRRYGYCEDAATV